MNQADDLRHFFRRAPVALYRTDANGKVLMANRAIAELLGYDSVEEMTEGLASVETLYVNPAQRALWIEEIGRIGVIADFDVELRRRDGSTIWVRDSARAIKDTRGAVVFYEGSLVDVTDKVRARLAKDEFVATVSHELRNPIAVVVGLGEELANNYESFTDMQRRDIAHLIARQADEAGWLIEDLLVAYRDDLDQLRVTPETFDVIKEIERVLEVVDYPIATPTYEGSTSVYADPGRTRQILRNLVSNAIRYGGDKIEMRLARVGDRIEIGVSDSGEPISEADVERIFRPYEQGSGPQHPKSVGLGLTVARRLARLMDGDLVYRYESGWSNFVLSLPSA